MTVAQLIERLKKLDPELIVYGAIGGAMELYYPNVVVLKTRMKYHSAKAPYTKVTQEEGEDTFEGVIIE